MSSLVIGTVLADVVDLDDVDLEELRDLATCTACGEVLPPDGRCLEIGACSRADRAATRGASRRTAKSAAAPAAWTGSGRVD